MITKKLLTALLCGASILLVQTCQAQSPDASPATSGTAQHPLDRFGNRKPGERLERLTEALSLTPDQQAKIKAIFLASRPQAKAAKENNTISERDRRLQLRAIREADGTQIRAILTPEQQAKWDAMQQNRKAGHAEKQ